MAKVVAQRDALQTLFRNTIDCVSMQGTVQPIIEAVLGAEHAQVKHAMCPSSSRDMCHESINFELHEHYELQALYVHAASKCSAR